MLQALFTVIATLLAYADVTNAVCGTPPIVWRNDNITCPARAVCADVFKTTRDWYNGTRCQETRVLSNCLCPGGSVCPFDDPQHQLFSSAMHSIFTCAPVCNLPYCGNVRPAQMPAGRNPLFGGNSRRPGGRPTPQRSNLPVAVTTIQNAAEFGDRTYNKMDCRCPRHHFPSTTRGRRRAVKASRYEYDFNRRRYSTLYVCATSPYQQEDPCQ